MSRSSFPPFLVMRSQTLLRRDNVSVILTARCVHVPVRKLQPTFADSVGLFNVIVVSSLVWLGVGVYWFVCASTLSIERRRKSMNFGRESGCGGPYLAAPPTSARVQSRFEFVRGICTGELQARTAISGWYQVPARTTQAPFGQMYKCKSKR